MAVSTKHPLYAIFAPDWTQLRDTYGGQRRIKDKGMQYLPATAGMIADGLLTDPIASDGALAYQAYRTRAVFPELHKEAVVATLGVMHRKPPVIELPSKLEPMRERATLRGESLEMLLQRINEAQLKMGRYGLLLDVPSGVPVADAVPYVATYEAETMINWDDGARQPNSATAKLNLVVLDETQEERVEDLEWEREERYRVLVLGSVMANEPAGKYRVAVLDEEASAISEDKFTEPSIGGKTLDFVPFVFVNPRDIVPEPDACPTLPISNADLTIYRGEADYRQSLFMQGQDTLVTIGSTKTDGRHRIGANASIDLPMSGDAKFIGVSSKGLTEQREALNNDYNRAQQRSGQLLDTVSREKESGDALRVRVAARTATINQIAIAGAFALQEILRMAAIWVGADPQEVIVEPNMDFTEDELGSKTVVDLMTAIGLGAPISRQSVHKLMQDRGLTKMTWDEEVEAIEEEAGMDPFKPSPTAEPEPDERTGEDPPPPAE